MNKNNFGFKIVSYIVEYLIISIIVIFIITSNTFIKTYLDNHIKEIVKIELINYSKEYLKH